VSFELLEKVKPKLSESVSIRADLRTIWMSEGAHEQTPRKKHASERTNGLPATAARSSFSRS